MRRQIGLLLLLLLLPFRGEEGKKFYLRESEVAAATWPKQQRRRRKLMVVYHRSLLFIAAPQLGGLNLKPLDATTVRGSRSRTGRGEEEGNFIYLSFSAMLLTQVNSAYSLPYFELPFSAPIVGK